VLKRGRKAYFWNVAYGEHRRDGFEPWCIHVLLIERSGAVKHIQLVPLGLTMGRDVRANFSIRDAWRFVPFYTTFKFAENSWTDANGRFYNWMTPSRLTSLLSDAGFERIEITQENSLCS
jgi:hypothetical protein